jgi:hypothetical protein
VRNRVTLYSRLHDVMTNSFPVLPKGHHWHLRVTEGPHCKGNAYSFVIIHCKPNREGFSHFGPKHMSPAECSGFIDGLKAAGQLRDFIGYLEVNENETIR